MQPPRRRSRTGSYLDATINVERAVVDAETGLRGYVITGKPLFLAPTQTAERRAAHRRGRARAGRDSANGTYVARANALADAARAYMTSYVPGVIARGHAAIRGPRARFGRLRSGSSWSTASVFRRQELEQLISARQAARQRAARHSANTAVTVAVVVLIVLTALTLALGGFLGWLLSAASAPGSARRSWPTRATLLDRGTTAEEVLDTFATLALERGSAYCLAEELPDRDAAGTGARPGQRRGRDPRPRPTIAERGGGAGSRSG